MKLINDKNEALNCVEIDETSATALSGDRLRILKMLTRKSMYAAEIARELGVDGQALHYHVKILEKAGLIRLSDYEGRRGGIAKKFVASAESFSVVLNNEKWARFTSTRKTVPKLFLPFLNNGIFNGKFIVGSPDPHGKYRARASEFPMLELAMLLGNYASFSFPLYILDTQVKNHEKEQNMIVAGGPKVNTLTAEINDGLPVRFDKATFEIYSKFSKKTYTGNIGIIELLPNPFSTNRKILLISGLNHAGTRAAILAMIKKMREIENGNDFNNRIIAKVVEGFDVDGDGIVDEVEIIE